jgi:branched-chain amino acid transport system permease protein
MPFLAAAGCGMLVAGLMGLLMAQLVRLSGVYFKIATFGFGIIVYQIISNTTWLTGGHVGIRGIPAISIFGTALTTRKELFILEMLALTIVYALLLRLCHGRVGRALSAIGQNESAARSVGIPTNAYRMVVITIGCAVAGLAGSFLPHLIGGLGSLPGAILGALILIVVPEYMRELAEYKMLVYGVLLVLCMMFLPTGLVALPATIADWVVRLRTRKK